MSKRIGVVTSGGDCPALNAVIGAIKISDAIAKLKVVVPEGSLVRTARALGIGFRD